MVRWDYDRKFGMFRSSVTGPDWFDELRENIIKARDRKTESLRYRQHKRRLFSKWDRVYNAFQQYMKVAPDPDEAVTWYHTICLQDFDLFCLNHVIPDNGLPMFPVEWQSNFAKMTEKYNFLFSLSSRKVGKSAFLQGLAPFWMCNSREQVRLFAPTDKQLLVREDVITNIRESDFLYEEFVIGRSQNTRKQGRLTLEEAFFGRNGSNFMGDTLSQKSSKGKSKVGAKGTRFLVDEWGLVEDYVFNTVILPMTADAHSDKKLAGFGTATYDVNPNMKEIWEDYEDDVSIYTRMTPWTEGVRQGALTRDYMKSSFKKNHVPCQFGLRYGICGRDWVKDGNVGINEQTGKLVYPGEEGYRDAWKCDECCYLSKSFAEEHWARFVREKTEYWPMADIKASGNPQLEWWHGEVIGNPVLAVSIDFGNLMYPTQIGVAEVIQSKMPRLILRDYQEIPPLSEKKKESSDRIANPLMLKIFEFLSPYEQWIKRYYFDVTGDKFGYLSYDLTHGVGRFPGFSKSKIYRNETSKTQKAEKGLDVWGIWNSGEFNFGMKESLKAAFQLHRIEVPIKEPFWSNYIYEFEHCDTQATEKGYIKYSNPKNGIRKRIDIVDMMSQLSLEISSIRRPVASFQVAQVIGGRMIVPKIAGKATRKVI